MSVSHETGLCLQGQGTFFFFLSKSPVSDPRYICVTVKTTPALPVIYQPGFVCVCDDEIIIILLVLLHISPNQLT